MMKEEFEKATGQRISQEDYEVVETVYMYYPGFEKKEQVYALWQGQGMVVFTDLYPRAQAIQEIDLQVSLLKSKRERLHTEKI